MNAGLVAAIVAMEMGRRMGAVWSENFLWVAATYVTAALIAGLLSLNAAAVSPLVIRTMAMALPAAYYTCRMRIGRAAEPKR